MKGADTLYPGDYLILDQETGEVRFQGPWNQCGEWLQKRGQTVDSPLYRIIRA